MPGQKTYDSYPAWIPGLSLLLSLTIYAIGAWLLSGFGAVAVLLYLLFCLWAEYRVLKLSCRYCCYFGKLCGVGKGLVAPLFFKKGDPKIFLEKSVGWKDLAPDFLVFLIPLLAGVIDLFLRFDFLTLGLVIVIALAALPGSGYMRACLLCVNCRQRELGCPAEKLFGKNQQ